MGQSGGNDIVIVGGGPVGLCAALNLARLGVPCTVVEKEAGPATDLRASTFHPPTLDLLEALGLTAPMVARGLRVPAWQIRLHETHERAVFDLGVLAEDTRHPYRLQFEQAAFCALALDAARSAPLVRLEMGTTVTALAQDDRGVTLRCASTTAGATGERELRAGWVIAADGAGSTLRRALDVPFDGQTYPEVTFLVTTRFPFEEHLPGLSLVNYVWRLGGNFALLRLPDRWRVSLYPDDGEDPTVTPDAGALEAKLQRIVPRAGRYEILESRPYRIHRRIVSGYRHGRVFLAGDAAHINSPTGGMGMNGGIHDALNLTEKLAVVRAGGDEALLDLYDRQRRPVAREEILGQADENRRRMLTRDPAWRREELARLQAIAADPAAARRHLLRSSMIEGLRRAAAIT